MSKSTMHKPNFCHLFMIFGGVVAVIVQSMCGQVSLAQSGSRPGAQENAFRLPEFEVASVKPADPKARNPIGLFTYPGGRVVATEFTLRNLLMVALNVQWFQISGPAWIDQTRYDIEAKPPASSLSIHSQPASSKSPPNDEQRQMLLALLIDRFQFKFHREMKEGTVYLLLKDPKGVKLQTPKDKSVLPWAGGIEGGAITHGTGIAGRNISMQQLSARLSGFLNRPVLDKTGIQGAFDFEFRTGNDDQDADVASSIITSLKGVGLKLEAAKGPVESIVVDHIEKPSPN